MAKKQVKLKSISQKVFEVNMQVRVFKRLNDKKLTWLFTAVQDEMQKRGLGLNNDRG